MDTIRHVQGGGTEKGTAMVIVRAFGDEPVKLMVVGRRGRSVLVAGRDGGHTVGFPSQYVYQFDAEQYNLLRGAWERGDRRALLSLWRETVHDS
jgi:hypothetical protein